MLPLLIKKSNNPVSNSTETQRGIKSWALEDRPREKLLLKGKSSLSESELIAILIRSGSAKSDALQTARHLLQSVKYNLNTLARLSVKELIRHKGIGHAKAITIVAALELGRRRKKHKIEKRIKINTSKNAYEAIRENLLDIPHEEFWAIFVNTANEIIKKYKISTGGVSGTLVDPKILYKAALEELASGLIVAHNHPSGNLKPSKMDIALTRQLKEAGKALDIRLLDHIIVGGKDYMSFVDEGLL